MKRIYITPKLNICNFDNEEILTASSVEITEKALKSGDLKVNGKSLDSNSNIFSIEF